MDNQTQITILNNKINSIELRMNKIENSFNKIIEELKVTKNRYFKLSKDLKKIEVDIDYEEGNKND